DTALEPHVASAAARAGAMRTDAVDTRTTLLLVRFRYHITTSQAERNWQLLAEDIGLLAYTGTPETAAWLDDEAGSRLLTATASGNMDIGQARHFHQRFLEASNALADHLNVVARERADALLDA